MTQLCLGAHVVILPVNLALKIVNKKCKLYCLGKYLY